MDFEVVAYPASRLSTIDLGRVGASKHAMYGLLELDVTIPRQRLRELRRQGRRISFTAWMARTIGGCVADHRLVHSLAFRRNSVIAFKDVDIALMVEREVAGVPVPLPLLVKATNRKSADEIDSEIDAARSQPILDERDAVLGQHSMPRWLFRLYYRMPQLLRVLIVKWLINDPFRIQALSGTVALTTVGGVGSPGWIVPTRSWHNAVFALGAVCRKPWVSDDAIQIRDILDMTVVLNHDVIDGNQAARFVRDLVRRVERAADLF